MPKFVLDPCVEDELWGIWYFIAQDNPDAATRVIDAAYETFKTLAANPGLGRPSLRLSQVADAGGNDVGAAISQASVSGMRKPTERGFARAADGGAAGQKN
jgi:hypothetical protein